MRKEILRLYAMGIIVTILALSIPEVQFHMQAVMYSSEAKSVITAVQNSSDYYVDKSAQALQALIQYIKPADTIYINGRSIGAIDTTNDFSLNHGQSISVEQCESILASYKSPAEGTCSDAIEYAQKHNIDFAYVLYMFIKESSAGMNKNWAGIKPDGNTTHNTGNIICAGYITCFGRFRDYTSWDEGWKDHIDLLVNYRDSQGDKTLEEAINRWAPPIENDTNAYYQEGVKQITSWREINTRANIPITPSDIKPITKNMVLLSDFYAKGIVWCFQDGRCPKDKYGNPLGEGQHFGDDFKLEVGEPVYAPVNGTFISCGAYSDPARIGEYIIYLTYDNYEFYSGHLANSIVFCQKNVGDPVIAGEIVGYGNANVAGPHTHIQLRKDGQLLDYMQYYNERIQNDKGRK